MKIILSGAPTARRSTRLPRLFKDHNTHRTLSAPLYVSFAAFERWAYGNLSILPRSPGARMCAITFSRLTSQQHKPASEKYIMCHAVFEL
jgi:hypothetical protein